HRFGCAAQARPRASAPSRGPSERIRYPVKVSSFLTDFTPEIPRAISEALALAPRVATSPVSVTTILLTQGLTTLPARRPLVVLSPGSRAPPAPRRPHRDPGPPARRPAQGDPVPSDPDPDPADLFARCRARTPARFVR